MAKRKVRIEFEIDRYHVDSDSVRILHEKEDGTMEEQGMVTELNLQIDAKSGGQYKLTKLEAVIG